MQSSTMITFASRVSQQLQAGSLAKSSVVNLNIDKVLSVLQYSSIRSRLQSQ